MDQQAQQIQRDFHSQGPKSPGGHSRSFSFRSDKSGGSQKTKEEQRKDQFWKGASKANPNAALSEAQPGVNAVLEESTLTPLRGLQHKDNFGNVITDPDLSNPTRPRLERPLDTIRSFEKAIDNGYKRRSSYVRAESYNGQQQDSQNANARRNSGYGYEGQNRYSNGTGGGYYGNQRPDSNHTAGSARRVAPTRNQSEPMYSQRVHTHGYQASQDTMQTGMTSGSDSTGPWANSTDPSSENSSLDRGPTVRPHQEYPPNGYGQTGYNSYGQGALENPIPEEGGAYPFQTPSGARRPIPLGNSGDAPRGDLPSTKRPEPEKRQSWLSRRFSRQK